MTTPLDLLRTIARMNYDGEELAQAGDITYEYLMGNDDAVTTLSSIIHEAREMVDNKGTCRHVRDINVYDPDTGGVVAVSIYKDDTSGGMFGIDSSYLATLDDHDPVIEPFNGTEVREACEHEWVDATNEVVSGGMVCIMPGCGAIKATEDEQGGSPR